MSAASIAAIADLDERPLSARQRYAAILVACGEFIDGYDLLVMGAALILIRPQFNLSPQEVGLLGAAAFLGAMIGLLVFGDLSDRLGRRAIFIVNLLFFVVFAIASAMACAGWRSPPTYASCHWRSLASASAAISPC